MFESIKNIFGNKAKTDIAELQVVKDANTDTDFKFNLGDEVKDDITGFKGVIEYRMQWLTNCNAYGVLPSGLDPHGKPKERQQFDEPRLKLLKPKVVKEVRHTGGCKDMPMESNRF